jgi:hypothetical protein
VKVAVPDGWRLEADGYGRDAHIITSPRNFFATIDWSSRCFRSGITTFGNAVGKRGFAGYRGRDWKQRLADDAVAWLRNLENAP